MAVAITENHEKRALAKPVVLTCQFRADPELVRKCQAAALPGLRKWRGQRVSEMPTLYPWSRLRELAHQEARLFVMYMKQQRHEYELLGELGGMGLWGPYMQKVDWGQKGDQRGNDGHVYPMGYVYGVDEVNFDKGVVFLIRGHFLAKYGRMVELEDAKEGLLLV